MNIAPFLNIPQAKDWNPVFLREQREFLSRVVKPVEPVAMMLARSYAERARAADYAAANNELREVAQMLRRHDLNLSWSDDELCQWCEAKAEKGAALVRAAECTDSAATLLGLVIKGRELAERYGIEAPDADEVGPLPMLRRLADAKWWRLKARKLQAREVERIAILLRRVRKGREIYCSDETVRRRSAQRWRNRRYLESTEAENQDGQRYTLAELADLSVSNPRIRRAELMVRTRGFDEVSQVLGHVREFWTMTTPSRFHRWTTMGQSVRENPRWDGSTPRQAQQWLTACWSRIRAALARAGVRLYGMRVVEAHHDGTPHWHAAMFYSPLWMVRAPFSFWPFTPAGRDGATAKTGAEFYPCELGRAAAPRVRAVVRRYMLEEERKGLRAAEKSGDRAAIAAARRLLRDAEAHRCDFKKIDPKKGDAAGYLAKYITKAIASDDAGDLVQQDLYGYDAGESARRVDAWASCNGVRQFQQIGGPSVSAWRELRRAMANESAQLDLLDAPLHVQHAASAADESDWQAFVLLMGGPTVKRDAQSVRLGYWHEHSADGEVIGQVFTRYGEPAAARLYGITYNEGAGHVLTRAHTWTLHRPGEERPDLGPSQELKRETDRAERAARAETEWSPWAFDVLEEDAPAGAVLGFCFSGAPPGAPLEFCQ